MDKVKEEQENALVFLAGSVWASWGSSAWGEHCRINVTSWSQESFEGTKREVFTVLCDAFLAENRFLPFLMPSNISEITCRYLVFTASMLLLIPWVSSMSARPNSTFAGCTYCVVHHIWKTIRVPKQIPLDVGYFLLSIMSTLWRTWGRRLRCTSDTLDLVWWRTLGITSYYHMVDCQSLHNYSREETEVLPHLGCDSSVDILM